MQTIVQGCLPKNPKTGGSMRTFEVYTLVLERFYSFVHCHWFDIINYNSLLFFSILKGEMAVMEEKA